MFPDPPPDGRSPPAPERRLAPTRGSLDAREGSDPLGRQGQAGETATPDRGARHGTGVGTSSAGLLEHRVHPAGSGDSGASSSSAWSCRSPIARRRVCSGSPTSTANAPARGCCCPAARPCTRSGCASISTSSSSMRPACRCGSSERSAVAGSSASAARAPCSNCRPSARRGHRRRARGCRRRPPVNQPGPTRTEEEGMLPEIETLGTIVVCEDDALDPRPAGREPRGRSLPGAGGADGLRRAALLPLQPARRAAARPRPSGRRRPRRAAPDPRLRRARRPSSTAACRC